MKRLTLVLAAFAALSAGCYKTTIVNNGAAPGASPLEYTDKWNHNAVIGLANFSGPQDAAKGCPGGWSAVQTKQGFIAGLVGSVTLNLYAPQELTILCK